MIDLERLILEAVAVQTDKSGDGTVNPEVVRKALKATLEGTTRALKSLEKQGLVAIDEKSGMVSITDAGRESLSGGA